jgi:predicted GH43/DUF377 family glycosyl hydrolase
VVITPPGWTTGCLPAQSPIDGDLVVFHRFDSCKRVNRCQDLAFGEGRWLDDTSAVISPRTEYWDNRKFGIAAPPLETPHGWLLLFHRVTKPDGIYKVEAMLLDRNDPRWCWPTPRRVCWNPKPRKSGWARRPTSSRPAGPW